MYLPIISIITPSYNQAQFLDQTIRSVVGQRQQIHEYFVLDGGSKDGSVDIIQKYADRIDWWVSEKDKGQSDAIHRGFVRATGDILYWLNSDDVLLPGTLAKVRQAFAANPHWDVLTGYSLHIDAQSRITGAFRMGLESLWMATHGTLHVCQQTCFFKRSLYEKVGGLNLDLHCVMDTDLWTRMLKAGAVWGHIPDYLACFRIHEAAKGSSWLKEYAKEHQWLAQTYPDCFGPRGFRYARYLHAASQVFTGRRLAAWRDTRRWKGQRVGDIFKAD